jgi:amino acid adenylation domain-containing protein/non-ribosomal peptide synthase protein (TIGR01720 family)
MKDTETLKALYKTLKATQKRVQELEMAGREPLAIIGMGCRFPGGASTLAKYRALLESGGDGIIEVPRERWDGQSYYNPDPDAPGKVTTNRAGFLKEPIDGFDCAFFHLSPKEVQSIDPQQRLLLEVCWEGFENAGIDITTLKGSKTGVFCGIANSDYGGAHLRSGDPEKIDGYSVTGTALSAAVGRISYLFGFEGPNMALDTACSSSLVAVHLACQSLRSGESDLAVAAGINLILTPEGHIGFSKLRALSADGRCKSFDDAADGYGRGEGCGLIILKRLSDAERDGDRISAVIRATAVNQDGRTNGFTAPSSIAQEKVLAKALENSGLGPEEIGYLEAHGTGTPLGDPIEMAAIGKVYASSARRGKPLYVGSAKANIGHLEAAAGIAGLIKAALTLEGGRIFPQANFTTPNRHIPWDEIAVRIPRELTAWPEGTRAAAVSSFGFSGTNAHAILEQRPPLPERVRQFERSHHILNLSARDGEGLKELAARYHEYLAGTDQEVEDICFTASVGRTHFPWRLSVTGTSREELRQGLEAFLPGQDSATAGVPEGEGLSDRRIVFLFTGQGSQYYQMGADLYQNQPLFRETMDRCDELLRPHLGCSLIELLYGDEATDSRLHETRYTQPVIFSVEYSLATLLASWGIKPDLVLGHSIGEYVAACIAGIFTLEEAITLVAARGKLMQSLPMNGAMAVISAGEERAREAIAGHRDQVSLAAMNAPKNTVISGDKEAIAKICTELGQEGLQTHILNVSHAFHSFLMEPVLDEFRALAGTIHYASPRLPIMANVSGSMAGADMARPDYWVTQMRQPVRFYDCMRAIGEEGYRIFIEVGGTSTLTNLARQSLPGHKGLWLSTLGRRDANANLKPGRVEGGSDWQPMLSCLAGLYSHGLDVDWQEFDRPYQRRKVLLPNYPFQRKRQWLDLTGPREKSSVLDAALAGAMYDKLNRLGSLSVLRIFKEAGVLPASGEGSSVQGLQERMGLSPEYQRLFAVLLVMLEKEGFVSLNDDTVTSLDPVDTLGIPEINREIAALEQEIAEVYPGIAPVAESFATCMDHYLDVLTGRTSYVEVLSPQGAMDLVNNLYSNNEIQAFFNRLVAEQVREWLSARRAEFPSALLRILEVGAGMGSATGQILPMISGLGNVTYCYTDMASAFIQHGRESFASNYPWMTFEILNIEEDLAAQGFAPGSWDMIIASNVLHATGRIDHTLNQVETLLSPGGVLIMNEVTKFQDIVCVIFGMSSGWWLFEDPECRLANCSSLSLDHWKEGLGRTGLVYEKQVGLQGDSFDSPMQCVILARKEGGEEMSVSENAGGAGGTIAGDKGGQAPVSSGRMEEIQSEVRRLMYEASEIEVSGADSDRNLFELGFASLMIARLKDLIKRTYGLDLQMSWFFSRTDTFNKIVEHIAAECSQTAEPAPGAQGALASATSIAGGADGLIGQQLELMSRQLRLLAEQLSAKPGAAKGDMGAMLNRQASLLQEMTPSRKGRTSEGAARVVKPTAGATKGAEYVAYRGVTGRERLELNLRQKEHLHKLIGRYTGLTAGSKERTRTYRPVFANTRNIAGFRPEWKEMIYQIIVDRAAGSHFTDIDGREYLDVTMGFGVYLFGHNPPFVQAALQRELLNGTPIGPMTERAGKVATLIHELTGVERVAFFNTGTEAVMAAVRIARTVTGRKKIVLFASSYHGHFDGLLAVKDYDGPMGRAVPMSPGTLPAMIQDIYVLDYGTDEALQFIELHGRELAAVLVEPVQSRRPELQPKAFLKELREITTATGAALIFDEMIVGFRVHPGGGQAWFGIQADIVTYGKVVGGGIPIGVVAGKAHYLDAVDGGMWNYGDGSFPERENTFIAGTFNHHPLAMAGASEVLSHLKESGPSLQENLNQRTEDLAERLNAFFAGEGLPLRMNHFGSLFRIPLKGDQELLYYHLLSRGVYIWEGRNCFLSTAHTDEDIDYFVESIEESIAEMRAGGLFPGQQAGSAVARTLPAAGPAEFPVSSAQKRLYALSLLEGGERGYHVPLAFIVREPLDPATVEECVRTLIRRHPALRTGFHLKELDVIQRVLEDVPFFIEVQESGASPELIAEEWMRSFDLSQAPLLRVCMATMDGGGVFLLFDAHHTVLDGISGDILIGEMIRLLKGEDLPPLKLTYRDYVEWEQSYLASTECKSHEEYWLEMFSREMPVLDLPTDRPRPAAKTFRGRRIFQEAMDRHRTTALKRLSARNGSSLFMVLFAAYFALLHKLTGQQDITVGTNFDGRKDGRFSGVIGMFTTTIAIRACPDREMPFKELLKGVKQTVLEAFDAQDYPFEMIVERLGLKRDISRNPLFDTVFVYEEIETKSINAGGLTISKYDLDNRSSTFDLVHEVLEIDGALHISLEFNTDLYDETTIRRFLSFYQAILDRILDDPDLRLGDIDLLDSEERRKILIDFNDTESAPATRMVIDLFEKQVQRTPEAEAIIFKDSSLTYHELNVRANRLAHHLTVHYGIGKETLAAVMMERCDWMIVAMLGILKAGGGYVPIDPGYPADRVWYMLAESGCTVVLTAGGEGIAPPDGQVVPPFLDVRDLPSDSDENPARQPGLDDLCYVIFTSGSTGKPKGCQIEHRNLSHYISWALEYYLKGREYGSFGLYTSLSFDLTVTSIFCTLLSGRCLTIYGDEMDILDVLAHNLSPDSRVDCLKITPAHIPLLKHLDLKSSNVCLAIVGGEALTIDQVRTLKGLNPQMRIVNEYGPTEFTVGCIIREMGAEDESVLIGKPIANTRVYILDAQLSPVPIGVEGEICLGGDGLARGYLNRPELTREKFIPNPFRQGERIYRTGDLGKWLPDGNIDCLGRADDQVKIHGYRIECGEIEAKLLDLPDVREAIVLPREMGGEKALVAYVVGAGVLGGAALRERLRQDLPDYMIPTWFVQLERLPLTTNGKVDRRSLPLPDTMAKPATPYAEPRNEGERRLAEVWCEVLGRKSIGIDENYFELGGDSIKAIQILSRLSQHNLKLEVRHIFETPTIRALAGKIVARSRTPHQGAIAGRVPLTAIQAWFFREQGEEVNHYAQAVMLRSQEPVDEMALRQALMKVQEHHDALRMTIRRKGEAIVQEIAGLEHPLAFTVADLRGRADGESELARIGAEIPASLDLELGPLMKAILCRLDDGDRILMVIHHCAVDGVSWRILLEDLRSGYDQALAGGKISLPLKADSFQLWAERVAKYSTSPDLLAELPYWRQVEETEALAIPADLAARTNYYEDAQTVTTTLDAEETRALLTEAHRAYHTEIEDLLLVGLGRAMNKEYGAKRGFIELEGHGREPLASDIDIGRTVGWFTSIYPVVLDIGGSEDIGLQIKGLKEDLRRIPHKGIGYGILKYLGPGAGDEMHSHRRARILFNYLGSFDSRGEDLFRIDEKPVGNVIGNRFARPSEIEVEGAVLGGRLQLSVSYNTRIHQKERVETFLRSYRDELRRVIDHCLSREAEELTPHDLTYKELTVPELDSILAECGIAKTNLKNIYPLSPLQEGMLFHALLADESDAYFLRVSFGIEGELDLARFKDAWNLLLARHDILRTVFVHKGLERPLQVCSRQGEIDFRCEDISTLSPDKQRRHLEEFKRRDREEGFDLTAKVPMRLSLFITGERRLEAFWTYHHILLDGWCAGILINELFTAYSTSRHGGLLDMAPAPPYSAYIGWLDTLNRPVTIDYWRTYLQGYDRSASLPRDYEGEQKGAYRPEVEILQLDSQTTGELKRFASGSRVTLNTLFQAAWGLVLDRLSGSDDVVFGATVSGRPSEVADIEKMVGLFINTIPVRLKMSPEKTVGQLIREVQDDALHGEAHRYCSLAEIQAVTSLKQELLDHVLVFENYPLAEELAELEQHYRLGFTIGEVEVFEQTNFDLTLVVEPGATTGVEFRYNANVFTRERMAGVKELFGVIITSLAGRAEMTIAELRQTLMSGEEKREQDFFIQTTSAINEEF